MKTILFRVLMFVVMGMFFVSACSTFSGPRTLSENQRERLKNVKVIQVVVDQSYDMAKGLTLPLYDTLRSMLEGAGFKVVNRQTKEFDARLDLRVNGQPVGSAYTGGNYRYSGATVNGTLLFAISGTVVYSNTFNGRQPVSLSITHFGFAPRYDYRRPQDAPFEEALCASEFYVFFREIMSHHWSVEKAVDSLLAFPNSDLCLVRGANELVAGLGKPAVEPLIRALNNKSPRVRKDAAAALGTIRDPRAVEPLIVALKDEQWSVRSYAARALG